MNTIEGYYFVDGQRVRQLFAVENGIKHHLICNLPFRVPHKSSFKIQKSIDYGKRRINKSRTHSKGQRLRFRPHRWIITD